MFVLRNLRAAFGEREVLHGIDLQLENGEIVHVLGRNGAGKSTLLRAICGLVKSSADALTLEGTSLCDLAPERRFDYGIGLMPQGHRVFASLTVGVNVTLASRRRGERPWLLDELRSRIRILDERFDQRAGTLSGGETQMVLLARALIGNPRVVLLDEPAEGLDGTSLTLLRELIVACAERGSAVLIAEQRSEALGAIATGVRLLEDGTFGDRQATA